MSLLESANSSGDSPNTQEWLPKGVGFRDTTLADEIGRIEITAPELLKGRKLREVMSLKNMDELGEIIGETITALIQRENNKAELKAQIGLLNYLDHEPQMWGDWEEVIDTYRTQLTDRLKALNKELE